MRIVSSDLSLLRRVFGAMFDRITQEGDPSSGAYMYNICAWCEYLLYTHHVNAVDIAFELLGQLLDISVTDFGSAALVQCANIWRLLCEELQSRSEEHTSELQSLMRISYAGFCLNKKNMHFIRVIN